MNDKSIESILHEERVFPPDEAFVSSARIGPADADDAGGVHETAWEMLMDRLGRIDVRLAADGPYFLGERYSLADLTLAYWMPTVEAHGRLQEVPAVERAYRTIRDRPALRALFDRRAE